MGEKRYRKVIYTAIFGNEIGLVPQTTLNGFDYICFTDNPNLKATPWKVIFMEMPVPNDLTRSNRKIKILANKYLSTYDISIYIDANMLIIGDLNELINTYLRDDKMAAFSHAQTVPDNRNCIYQEYEAILDLKAKGIYDKDNPTILKKHIDKLKAEEYPTNNGLIKGGCLVRYHNDPDVIKVMEDWWYMIEHYSKRDQMSFNYVAWKNNFNYSTIPGDIRKGNPYIYWLGKPRKNWTEKVVKVKLKMKLGLIKTHKP